MRPFGTQPWQMKTGSLRRGRAAGVGGLAFPGAGAVAGGLEGACLRVRAVRRGRPPMDRSWPSI